ncbi:MAG: SET domain-containing protein-lysine N-methyltransferase [Chloroflexi bacterium]|nr:SET domain-containing protein-lysine N-methyltransferase [Chloroflexota bacterium]
MLAIRDTGARGRGVFALRRFARGELIERTPVIVLADGDRWQLNLTVLKNYMFGWGPDYQQAAIALGYGSIFNHSYTPNVVWELELEERMIRFIAWRDVECGDEITINYNFYPDDTRPLWFETV